MSKPLSKRIREMDGAYIAVGLAGPHPSGMDAGKLASILKDGTQDGRIPARDFLTPAVEAAAPAVRHALKTAASAALRGKDPRPAMQRGALAAHEHLIKAIENFDTPPNAPSTIRKKGKDDPLVDSGALLDLTFGEYALGDLAK